MTYTHNSGRASQSGGSVVLSLSSSSPPPPHAASVAMSSMPSNVRNMLAVCVPAVAAAITPVGDAAAQDRWNTWDKRLHLGGSMVLGLAATAQTDSNAKAYGGCLAIGAGKELVSWAADRSNKPSAKDMAMNALGCGIGVAGGRFSLAASGGRREVTFSWEY